MLIIGRQTEERTQKRKWDTLLEGCEARLQLAHDTHSTLMARCTAGNTALVVIVLIVASIGRLRTKKYKKETKHGGESNRGERETEKERSV